MAGSAVKAAEKKVIVIFVQFQDLSFTTPQAEFKAFTDSLSLYFNDQFHGDPAYSFDAGPVVTLGRKYSYYGANDSSQSDVLMYQGVEEACRAAADSINFADYSNGSETSVRDVLIMVPGQSEELSGDKNLFRPQYVSLIDRSSYLFLDGRRITDYALCCELGPDGGFSGIGDMAHEYSHILGLKDLYDTDGEGSGGLSKALWGRTALMDKGNTNMGGHIPPNYNAADFFTLGKGKGEVLDSAGHYTLRPISEEGHYYIFKGPAEGEVFLMECREDKGWDSGIGGSGMLIYHYDRSEGDALWSDYYSSSLTASQRWTHNQLNCNPAHQCVELEAPDEDHAFFPSGNNVDFTSETTPAFRFWDGTPSPLAVTGIRHNGDRSVSFNLVKPLAILPPIPFQTSVIMQWECDGSIEVDSCAVRCYSGGNQVTALRGTRNQDGGWGCYVRGLSPNTSYVFTILLYRHGKAIYSGETRATTLSQRKGMFPFIHLNYPDRNPDGSFPKGCRIPLQVFNASDAALIAWFYNNLNVSAGTDGLFTLEKSGILSARIYWEDGSCDIIQKTITVR